MLEKPNLPDEKIIACLSDEYALRVAEITFLALGADKDTAAYHAVADDGAQYFIKLRQGTFDETSVALPRFLYDEGIAQIIPPLTTSAGRLRAELDAFKLILYPFVVGEDAYGFPLTPRQWHDFGAALKQIHNLQLPPALHKHIRRETFSAEWRGALAAFLRRRTHDSDDALARALTAFLQTKRAELDALVARAQELAQQLLPQALEFVLCHADLHAGNLMTDEHNAVYILDWDNPILAPKERDLMYIGGGQFANVYSPQEEEFLFYAGYGDTSLHPVAMAYYRYARIVEDIAVECAQIFSPDTGAQDREREFEFLKSNFSPGGVLEIAYRSDRTRQHLL